MERSATSKRVKAYRDRSENARLNASCNAVTDTVSNAPPDPVFKETSKQTVRQSTSKALFDREITTNGSMSTSPKTARPTAANWKGARVWAAYSGYHPRTVLTPARRTLIANRLKNYGEDRLIAAIHGMHRTSHNLGLNDDGTTKPGGVYLDIELCLRTAAHIERFERNAAASRPLSTVDIAAEQNEILRWSLVLGRKGCPLPSRLHLPKLHALGMSPTQVLERLNGHSFETFDQVLREVESHVSDV